MDDGSSERAAGMDGVTCVITNPERFKARLAIGENVYATRRALRSLGSLWDTGGAAGTGVGFAKSALVAGTFFAPAASVNPLVWAGIMAPAVAATPVSWVVAAALAAGGAWYGVSRWMASGPDAYVDVIPKFLNTPIDVLAMRLLDLNAALAFRIAAADGRVDATERDAIRDHYTHDWGYDPAYLATALPMIETDVLSRGEDTSIDRMASAIIDFHARSRDCAPDAMQKELLTFLNEVAAADGIDAPTARDALSAVERTLSGARALSLKRATTDFSEWTRTLGEAAHDAAGDVRAGVAQTLVIGRKGLNEAGTVASNMIDSERLSRGLETVRSASDQAAQTVTSTGRSIGRTIGGFAARISSAAREAIVGDPNSGSAETRDYAAARGDADDEIGRINVLIAGNTGVGKSTLVNAVFGDAVAPTGAGLPVTQTVTLYEAPNAPLNLWDSRGFEAGDDEAVRAVDSKLAEMRATGDVAAQIHVAWLCISAMSNRVEPVHRRFLADMKARGIPVIVVFTQSYRPMPTEARVQAEPASAQIDVLAVDEPSFDRTAFGLEALVEATDRVLPEARKTAFAAAQRVQWSLKKSAARRVVTAAATTAAGTAIAPGHSIVLSLIQVGMLAKIDRVFGHSMLADGGAAKLMIGTGASRGGQWLFGTLLSDGLKASGIGYAAGVAIGGAVGSTITSAMGLGYIEALSRYLESGSDVNLDKVAELVTTATRHAAKVRA